VNQKEVRRKLEELILKIKEDDELSLNYSIGANEIAPKDGCRQYTADTSRYTINIKVNGGGGELGVTRIPILAEVKRDAICQQN